MAVHQAYRNIADTAAHARGERVVGFPLRAADDRDASSAGTAARTDSAQSADETKTRDFSGIAIPTVAEPIADFVDGRPSLTRSKAGPLILGCDSMFLLDGECYGKPHSEEVARERLRAMRGATGELWTGHCLIDFASGRMVRGASKATCTSANIPTWISNATSPPASRWKWPDRSLWKVSAARSSTRSKAIRTASSA